jgi:hypothetical protein
MKTQKGKILQMILFFTLFNGGLASIAEPDPGSGAFKTTGSAIRDQDLQNAHHISESVETIFWVKILKSLLMRIRTWDLFDPGSGLGKIRIRDPG